MWACNPDGVAKRRTNIDALPFLLNYNITLDPLARLGTAFLRTSCRFELDTDGNLLPGSVCNAYSNDGNSVASDVLLQGGYTVTEDPTSGLCKVEGTTTTLSGTVINEVVDATVNRSSTRFSGIELVDATAIPFDPSSGITGGLGKGTREFTFYRAD